MTAVVVVLGIIQPSFPVIPKSCYALSHSCSVWRQAKMWGCVDYCCETTEFMQHVPIFPPNFITKHLLIRWILGSGVWHNSLTTNYHCKSCIVLMIWRADGWWSWQHWRLKHRTFQWHEDIDGAEYLRSDTKATRKSASPSRTQATTLSRTRVPRCRGMAGCASDGPAAAAAAAVIMPPASFADPAADTPEVRDRRFLGAAPSSPSAGLPGLVGCSCGGSSSSSPTGR